MSRQNKVNPDHYTTAGRLSPDDLARERWKKSEPPMGGRRGRNRKAMPPWMAETGATGESGARTTGAAGAQVAASVNEQSNAEDEAAQQPQAKPRRRGNKDAANVRALHAASPTPPRKDRARPRATAKTSKTASRGKQKATPQRRAAKAAKQGAARKRATNKTGRRVAKARKR